MIDKGSLVKSRGILTLFYSSTSGTSKSTALQFQQTLESHDFVAPLLNIGDLNFEDFLKFEGFMVFFLSTYGDGGAPRDGQTFLQNVLALPTDTNLSRINFAIMAFGNSSFEHHCGFAVKVDKMLQKLKANQFYQTIYCDAGSRTKCVSEVFASWSEHFVDRLIKMFPLKQISKSSLGTPYRAIIFKQKNYDWESSANFFKVKKQFQIFSHLKKVKVLHCNELRKFSDGRSTLWIRLNAAEGLSLSPACNINVFPLNVLEQKYSNDEIVSFESEKSTIPFCPIPLNLLRSMLNLNQLASVKMVKEALLLSSSSQCSKYEAKLKSKEEIQISLKELIEDLDPQIEFYGSIDLNYVRPYTLASWDPQEKYLDICVSLIDGGLASSYFKTFPSEIRISTTPSTFYIPVDRPLILIANGSGISAFRSLIHYYSQLNVKKASIRLYFGIQNRLNDFYFGSELESYQKKGLIQLRVAESRAENSPKSYVQDLLRAEIQFLREHLFLRQGVIFICGGRGMANAVNSVIFDAVTLEIKIPYKSFTTVSSFKHSKTIVEEVFG